LYLCRDWTKTVNRRTGCGQIKRIWRHGVYNRSCGDSERGEIPRPHPAESLRERDTVAVAKELADLLYVVYGTAVSCGIDMEPVFREVHRSNMSKVGGHKREDGKWVKPSTYSPARLELILVDQSGKEGA